MKKTISVILFSCLIFVLTAFAMNQNDIAPTYPYYHETIIILDAGHGGKDGGASSKSGVVERDLVFNITQTVADYLRQSGFYVVLTREDSQDLAPIHASNRKRADLAKRLEIINAHEDAIAISIHANAFGDTRIAGAQTFYDPKLLENKLLATAISERLDAHIPPIRGKQKAVNHLYILRHAEIPATLVEVGFLSNEKEAELLAQPHYQHLVAYSIFEGILTFISE